MTSLSRSPEEYDLMRSRNCVDVMDCIEKLQEGDKLVRFSGLSTRNRFLMPGVADEIDANDTCEGLMLSGDQLNDGDAALLAQSLRSNVSIRILLIGSNDISSKGLYKLAQSLKVNQTLNLLDISRNAIGNRLEGLRELGKALKVNCTLTKLTLDGNRINNRGLKILCSGLTDNDSLTTLSLSDNQIGDAGARLLAFTLLQNRRTSLIHLNLYSNQITDEGGLAILDSIRENYIILSCYIRYNQIDNLIEEEVERIASRNQQRLDEGGAEFKRILQSGESTQWRRSKLMVLGSDRKCKRRFIGSLFDIRSTYLQSNSSKRIFEVRLATAQQVGGWSLGESTIECPYKVRVVLWVNEWNYPLVLVAEYKPCYTSELAAEAVERSRTGLASPEELQRLRTKKMLRKSAKVGPLMSDNDIKRSFSWRLLRGAAWYDFAFRVWDYSNALLFSNLQQAFFTPNAVYVLVFSLKELKSELAYIVQCLKSLQAFAPRATVLLVASGSSRSRVWIHSAADILSRLLSQEFSQLHLLRQKRLPFFLMDKGNLTILRGVLETALRTSDEELVVSMRWVRCLDLLLADDEKPLHPFEYVRTVAKTVGITHSLEVVDMLKLFHQLGFVIYFSLSSSLRDVVITDPNWLTSAATKLLEPLSSSLEELASVETAGLANDFRRLCGRGLGSTDLIHFLWNSSEADFLLELMRFSMLLSDWSFSTQDRLFLIPSLIRNTENVKPRGVSCKVDFSNGPHYYGIFHRMCCLFVAYSNGLGRCPEPVIATESCKVYFSQVVIYLERASQSVIKVVVEEAQHCTSVLPVIVSLLRKLRQDNKVRNTMWLECESGYVKYQVAADNNMSPWFALHRSSREFQTNLEIDAFLDRLEEETRTGNSACF